MNRFKASVGILLCLILLCMFSLLELRIQSRNFLTLTDAVQDAAERNDIPGALLALDDLEANWKHYHDITGIFVNGAELDAIREILSELRPMLMDEHSEVFAELAKMRRLIESIYEEEIPEIWHIL